MTDQSCPLDLSFNSEILEPTDATTCQGGNAELLDLSRSKTPELQTKPLDLSMKSGASVKATKKNAPTIKREVDKVTYYCCKYCQHMPYIKKRCWEKHEKICEDNFRRIVGELMLKAPQHFWWDLDNPPHDV